jgi:integrase
MLPEHGRLQYYHLFGLIAVTGMRLSEAIGLQRSDVDLEGGVLTVRQTKFGKSPATLASDDPRSASQLRQTARPSSRIALRPIFLCRGARGFTVISGTCHARSVCDVLVIVSGRACTTCGIHSPSARCLAGIAEAWDVERSLPVLSTYLGHTCVRDTYWYLSACPDLM